MGVTPSRKPEVTSATLKQLSYGSRRRGSSRHSNTSMLSFGDQYSELETELSPPNGNLLRLYGMNVNE
ncbi:uncharacterized protein YALI1_D03320g [Yarrowia lipolytica]|uniref:Uncharacterized protein n=1 Tax=Yarrowia lipolytica TaxID=4952 RepID=A0A1D8NCX8_YARLL|nr:hypothetical protein YALI1_D03320g [Yarrowia lipolytica]